jgi:hypothetical protein
MNKRKASGPPGRQPEPDPSLINQLSDLCRDRHHRNSRSGAMQQLRNLGEDRAHPDPDPQALVRLFAIVSPSLLAGPLPEFGSAGWLALDGEDPRRQHALTRAALCWWTQAAFSQEAA